MLEDPEIAELEDGDGLAPLYHIEGISLHISSISSRPTLISILS
jgi:hypothetical protein